MSILQFANLITRQLNAHRPDWEWARLPSVEHGVLSAHVLVGSKRESRFISLDNGTGKLEARTYDLVTNKHGFDDRLSLALNP